MDDAYWLQHALNLAQKAQAQGEVPVGSVIVDANNTIIGEGYNCPISMHDPTAHAEIVAMRAAAQTLQNYRLLNTTLYVTLEPCIMCAGAMVHARVKRVVFGTSDPKAGAAGSICNIFALQSLNHRVEYTADGLVEPCSAILKQFFRERR
jgi:tRNA(adenine34) deaminase